MGRILGHLSAWGFAEFIHSLDYTLAQRAGEMRHASWDNSSIVRDTGGRPWIISDGAPMRLGSFEAYKPLLRAPSVSNYETK